MGTTHRMALRTQGGGTHPGPPRRLHAFILWLLLLAGVLAKTDSTASGGFPSPPLLAAITCPAPDNSPFPEELPPSPTAPAGAVAGTFAVTPTGEATYAIPLLVPPGRAGM